MKYRWANECASWHVEWTHAPSLSCNIIPRECLYFITLLCVTIKSRTIDSIIETFIQYKYHCILKVFDAFLVITFTKWIHCYEISCDQVQLNHLHPQFKNQLEFVHCGTCRSHHQPLPAFINVPDLAVANVDVVLVLPQLTVNINKNHYYSSTVKCIEFLGLTNTDSNITSIFCDSNVFFIYFMNISHTDCSFWDRWKSIDWILARRNCNRKQSWTITITIRWISN